MKQDMIVILDLGSTQNTVLAREIRDLGVYSEIYPHDITPQALKALPNVRGVILFGGENRVVDGQEIDVDPALYGQELKYDFVIMDKQRDDLEWKLVKAFIEKKKPIWGICRGIQVLNAYFGGTLYQDIPDQIGGDHAKGVCHPCTLKKDSILGKLFGESMEINSYHHQALDQLASCLVATAWSDSNGHQIVEAVEHESLPIWAVQWHPERMTGPVTNPKNCVDSLPMFEYVVNQCR